MSAKVVSAINAMHEALKSYFGCDFAYTIMGRGKVIAASNGYHGVVRPKSEAKDLESCFEVPE
jgi:hypothetical protein